jgi:hypothetical protein
LARCPRDFSRERLIFRRKEEKKTGKLKKEEQQKANVATAIEAWSAINFAKYRFNMFSIIARPAYLISRNFFSPLNNETYKNPPIVCQ